MSTLPYPGLAFRVTWHVGQHFQSCGFLNERYTVEDFVYFPCMVTGIVVPWVKFKDIVIFTSFSANKIGNFHSRQQLINFSYLLIEFKHVLAINGLYVHFDTNTMRIR